MLEEQAIEEAKKGGGEVLGKKKRRGRIEVVGESRKKKRMGRGEIVAGMDGSASTGIGQADAG